MLPAPLFLVTKGAPSENSSDPILKYILILSILSSSPISSCFHQISSTEIFLRSSSVATPAYGQTVVYVAITNASVNLAGPGADFKFVGRVSGSGSTPPQRRGLFLPQHVSFLVETILYFAVSDYEVLMYSRHPTVVRTYAHMCGHHCRVH